MTRSEINRDNAQKLWSNPSSRKHMLKIRKIQANREENLIRNSNALKRFWSNPINKARMIKDRAKSKKYKNRHPKSCFKKGSIPWNKGLTKKNNNSLKKISNRLKGKIPDYNKYRCNYIPLDGKPIIKMRSSWEVIFAHWITKHRITWLYEPKHFYIGNGKWKGITYTPDFYIPRLKLYIEIKGHFSKEFGRKLVEFHKRYKKKKIIIISRKELLSKMMEEVFS